MLARADVGIDGVCRSYLRPLRLGGLRVFLPDVEQVAYGVLQSVIDALERNFTDAFAFGRVGAVVGHLAFGFTLELPEHKQGDRCGSQAHYDADKPLLIHLVPPRRKPHAATARKNRDQRDQRQ